MRVDRWAASQPVQAWQPLKLRDSHLLAIEINALRVAEIATLCRECAFWRERCQHLEAVVNLLAPKFARRAWEKVESS